MVKHCRLLSKVVRYFIVCKVYIAEQEDIADELFTKLSKNPLTVLSG